MPDVQNSIYSIHPGFAMEASSMRNLRERTGRDLEEWIEIVERDGPADRKERREWLKDVHGFTSNYAGWVAGRSCGDLGTDAYDPDALAEQQYAGKKEALRPIYDALLKLGFSMGSDAKACPCETMVPLFRKHVFGQIKATTNSRVDLGLCLRGVAPQGRLISTGGEAKGDRITHRIPISELVEIDGEVSDWMKRAYEASA